MSDLTHQLTAQPMPNGLVCVQLTGHTGRTLSVPVEPRTAHQAADMLRAAAAEAELDHPRGRVDVVSPLTAQPDHTGRVRVVLLDTEPDSYRSVGVTIEPGAVRAYAAVLDVVADDTERKYPKGVDGK